MSKYDYTNSTIDKSDKKDYIFMKNFLQYWNC